MALAIVFTSLLIIFPIILIIPKHGLMRYIEKYNNAVYGNSNVQSKVRGKKRKGKGLNYFLEFWKNSFNFKGNTKRSEFWITQLFLLFQYVYVVILGINIYLINYSSKIYCWGNYFGCREIDERLIFQFTINLIIGFSFLTLIPSLSLQIRRLRDFGRNPLWVLISLIPFVGGILLLIFYLSPSKEDIRQRKLEGLEELLSKGTIDEEEYKYMRKQILMKFVD